MLYIVCFWHLDDYAPALHFDNSVTQLLTVCVLGLFVFLFGLTLSGRYRIARPTDVWSFYLRRLRRIYPMYVLAALGFLLAGVTTPQMALKGLLFLNVLTGSSPSTLWFVEMICLFYLVAPLLLYSYKPSRALILGVALSATVLLASRATHGTVDLRLAQYLPMFVGGICMGRYAGRERLLKSTLLFSLSLVVLPLLWWISRGVVDEVAAVGVRQLAILASLPLFFLGADWVARCLPSRFISVISYCSYGVYLLHRLTLKAAVQLYQPDLWWTSLLYLLCLWVPLTYGLAWILQWATDRYTLRVCAKAGSLKKKELSVSRTATVVIVCIAASAVLGAAVLAVVFAVQSERAMLSRLDAYTAAALARQDRVQPADHLPFAPFYIFESSTVPWDTLAPKLEAVYGPDVDKEVLGTFPVPGDLDGSDLSGITWDRETIYFPAYGPYALYTTIGAFKILLLDPETLEDARVLQIASFVSGSIVHSLDDAGSIIPPYSKDTLITDRLLRPFFASDQPLKLMCDGASKFLASVLLRLEYRVQLIDLRTAGGATGHVVMQVFLPRQQSYVMIDPDYGASVHDAAGRLLPIQELAVLVHTNPSSLRVEDIGNKSFLEPAYSDSKRTPAFFWTPDKSQQRKAVAQDQYLRMLRDATALYCVWDATSDRNWISSDYVRWDGTVPAE
jgi:peptidoglycan/LPS O-acetylase OafA/YrhL